MQTIRLPRGNIIQIRNLSIYLSALKHLDHELWERPVDDPQTICPRRGVFLVSSLWDNFVGYTLLYRVYYVLGVSRLTLGLGLPPPPRPPPKKRNNTKTSV